MNLIQQRLNSLNTGTVQQSNQDIFLQNMKDLKQMLGNSGNPQQLAVQLMSNNPEFQEVLQLYQAGKSPQELITMIANKRGLDPVFVMSQLK